MRTAVAGSETGVGMKPGKPEASMSGKPVQPGPGV